MTSERFTVPDVSSGHCKEMIEAALTPLNGIERAIVDIDSRTVEVGFDEAVLDRTAVVRAIEASGYVVAGRPASARPPT